MKTIEVLIKPTGEVTVETKGFAGAACQAASRQLEQALGLKGREQLTTEFHASKVSQSVHERPGP